MNQSNFGLVEIVGFQQFMNVSHNMFVFLPKRLGYLKAGRDGGEGAGVIMPLLTPARIGLLKS